MLSEYVLTPRRPTCLPMQVDSLHARGQKWLPWVLPAIKVRGHGSIAALPCCKPACRCNTASAQLSAGCNLACAVTATVGLLPQSHKSSNEGLPVPPRLQLDPNYTLYKDALAAQALMLDAYGRALLGQASSGLPWHGGGRAVAAS